MVVSILLLEEVGVVIMRDRTLISDFNCKKS